MISRVLFVSFVVLSVSGCVQKNLDDRIADANEKYAAQSGKRSGAIDPSAQKVNPLVRLECSTKVGTKISALMDGPSQIVTINGAVFRYVDRFDDSEGKDTLMFDRVSNGEKYALFIQSDNVPVMLTIYSQKKGAMTFSCKPYSE